jgi:hypothetical protein
MTYNAQQDNLPTCLGKEKIMPLLLMLLLLFVAEVVAGGIGH